MTKVSRLLPLLLAPLLMGSSGCDELPNRLPSDPRNTPANASTSLWRGTSSDGTYSNVRQVSTGPNEFSFTENWYEGHKAFQVVHTVGKGRYEPSTGTNIYTYSKPEAGVVVVKTSESPDGRQTTDTVINSTVPRFQVGETITYIRLD
ncbi:hypothetical protein [Vulcanococcus limneticus]|uniref:hypothetical protein n=1 Tax=Vulcanococcus limneticus TaxID=2170428 RepID=UPI00398C20B6